MMTLRTLLGVLAGFSLLPGLGCKETGEEKGKEQPPEKIDKAMTREERVVRAAVDLALSNRDPYSEVERAYAGQATAAATHTEGGESVGGTDAEGLVRALCKWAAQGGKHGDGGEQPSGAEQEEWTNECTSDRDISSLRRLPVALLARLIEASVLLGRRAIECRAAFILGDGSAKHRLEVALLPVHDALDSPSSGVTDALGCVNLAVELYGCLATRPCEILRAATQWSVPGCDDLAQRISAQCGSGYL